MDLSDDLSSIEGLARLYRRRVEACDVTTGGCISPDAMLALLQREGSENERLVTLEHVTPYPAVGTALPVRSRLPSAGEPARGETGDIALSAPAAGTSQTGAIAFTWHTVPEVSAYVLEIQGAECAVVRSDATADTTAEPRSSAFRDVKVRGPS